MSKLEDKLTASLKPVQGKTIPRKVASQALAKAEAKAKAKPTAAMPSPQLRRKAVARPSDLNDPAPALHPDHIWPD